jgi:hypothetical protein
MDNVVDLYKNKSREFASAPRSPGAQVDVCGVVGYDGSMGMWMQSVENRLGRLEDAINLLRSEVRTEVKWILGAFAVGFVTLLGVMAKGFGWL